MTRLTGCNHEPGRENGGRLRQGAGVTQGLMEAGKRFGCQKRHACLLVRGRDLQGWEEPLGEAPEGPHTLGHGEPSGAVGLSSSLRGPSALGGPPYPLSQAICPPEHPLLFRAPSAVMGPVGMQERWEETHNPNVCCSTIYSS